jgi:EthD domain
VEKVVYVLWRDAATPVDAWSEGLRTAGVAALPSAGALGVQVNVADEAVAGALLRLTELDPQMEAAVSVWVDSARTAARRPLDDALATVPGTARVEAYLVTESEPLRNTAHRVAPGERTPGFANLAFLRRPASMSLEAWIAAWHDGHTQVAIDTQSTFGYVQNVVARRLTPDAPAVDGIVEELFPIEALTDMHAFFDAPDDDELARRMTLMTESTARFGADRTLDVVPTSRYVLSTPSNSSR